MRRPYSLRLIHFHEIPGVEIVTRTASTPDGKRGWLIVPRDVARRIKGDG